MAHLLFPPHPDNYVMETQMPLFYRNMSKYKIIDHLQIKTHKRI